MKLKILFLFPFIFFLSSFILFQKTFAQDIVFDWKHIISNTQSNEAKCIRTDSAGYVYVGGIIKGTLTFLDTTVNATGIYESFVAKLTPAGNLVWFKWFRSNFCRIESICIDRENKLYVTGIYGNSVSFDTIIHSNNTDSLSVTNMFIAKFDTAGVLLWAKNTQGVDYIAGDGTGPLKKLTVDNDNNLIVTGRCIDKLQYFDTIANITTHDSTWVTTPNPHWEYYQNETGFLAKYTSAGQKLWVKKIGGVNCNPYAVKTDNENNIIVTGNFVNHAVFESTILYTNWGGDIVYNIFLTKYFSNGNLNWVQRAGGASSDNYCYEIDADNENNIYISGAVSGNNCEFGGTIYPFGGLEAFVAKYDTNGIIKWVFQIGTSHITGNYVNNQSRSIKIFGNNIYVLGSFMDTLSYGNVLLQSDGKYETFLLKLNLDGNVLEAGQYIAHMFSYPQELAIDKNNNIYIAGIQSNKILIGKIQSLFPVNAVETYFNASVFKLYPNPSNGNFYIEVNSLNRNKEYDVTIIDIYGKIILENKILETINLYNLSMLEKGLYFVRISNKSEINTYKILIQ